jgi:hypothetical protein
MGMVVLRADVDGIELVAELVLKRLEGELG